MDVQDIHRLQHLWAADLWERRNGKSNLTKHTLLGRASSLSPVYLQAINLAKLHIQPEAKVMVDSPFTRTLHQSSTTA